MYKFKSCKAAIINTNQYNYNHQSDKEPVHFFRGNLFIYGASQHPPTNPAQNHHNQHADGKSRYAFRHDRGDQACNLREKDDIQGILWGCFGIHGKEIKQHYQIDRSAADSKERGHGSEGGSDQDAENRIGNPERADPFFINCVEQGAGRDQQQD